MIEDRESVSLKHAVEKLRIMFENRKKQPYTILNKAFIIKLGLIDARDQFKFECFYKTNDEILDVLMVDEEFDYLVEPNKPIKTFSLEGYAKYNELDYQ